MFSKIKYFFYGIFLPNLIILWHLKSKIKFIWTELYFRQWYLTRKIKLQGSFCGWRIRIRYFPGSGSGWPKKTGSDRIRIRNTAWNLRPHLRQLKYLSYCLCWRWHIKVHCNFRSCLIINETWHSWRAVPFKLAKCACQLRTSTAHVYCAFNVVLLVFNKSCIYLSWQTSGSSTTRLKVQKDLGKQISLISTWS